MISYSIVLVACLLSITSVYGAINCHVWKAISPVANDKWCFEHCEWSIQNCQQMGRTDLEACVPELMAQFKTDCARSGPGRPNPGPGPKPTTKPGVTTKPPVTPTIDCSRQVPIWEVRSKIVTTNWCKKMCEWAKSECNSLPCTLDKMRVNGGMICVDKDLLPTTKPPEAPSEAPKTPPPDPTARCYIRMTVDKKECQPADGNPSQHQCTSYNVKIGAKWYGEKNEVIWGSEAECKAAPRPSGGGGGGNGGRGDKVEKDCPTFEPDLVPKGGFPGKKGLERLLNKEIFDKFFFGRTKGPTCARGIKIFTWEAMVAAASHPSFKDFCNNGDIDKDKRELAAFFAHTAHETTGGWDTAPCGKAAWGYCFVEEVGCEKGTCNGYCQEGNPCGNYKPSYDCTCKAGKTYHGRGAIQLSWNYNYGQYGKFRGDADELLRNPSRVAEDSALAFGSAFWFWMTPQSPKPSCHAAITGKWKPTSADKAAGRKPGFGATTNIINGGLECNSGGGNEKEENRVLNYERFCKVMGVSPGDNLRCRNQRKFG